MARHSNEYIAEQKLKAERKAEQVLFGHCLLVFSLLMFMGIIAKIDTYVLISPIFLTIGILGFFATILLSRIRRWKR